MITQPGTCSTLVVLVPIVISLLSAIKARQEVVRNKVTAPQSGRER